MSGLCPIGIQPTANLAVSLPRMSRKGTILFIALSVIWGIPYLFIRVAIDELDPTVVIFARSLPAAVLLLLWSWKRGVLRSNLKYWKAATLFAAVEMIFPWWLITAAEKDISSGLTGVLLATVPLAGVLIARVQGDSNALNSKRLLGLLTGIVGVFLLVGFNPGKESVALIPVAMVLVAAIGYAFGPVVINRVLAGADDGTVIAMSLTVVSVVYAPLAFILRPTQSTTVSAWVAVAILAIVCTTIAFLVFFALINEVGPIRATLVTYINPAVALLLGIIFLSEPITPGLIIGFPLVLAGSWIASRKV